MKFLAGSGVLRRNASRLALGALWLGLSCGGLAILAWYDRLPGTSQSDLLQWPADSKIHLSERGATLIVFAHPRCPCTRASLGELEKIVARSGSSVATWVVFLKPAGSDDAWDRTDLVNTAAAIPGVHILHDLDGVEARRFRATTSGQALLFSDRGELLFNGGITLARGHAGDNAGRSAIESYLANRTPACRQTPVFGCPIAVTPQQN
jgi:hypothetical protein